MLYKKDFKAIAQIIKGEYNTENRTGEIEYDNGFEQALQNLSAKLADYFGQDNPRFDRQKFYDACFKD